MVCNLFSTLENLYHQHGVNKTYIVAFSGGVDSHVLLHIFASLRSLYPVQLQAIHINHGLSPHAAAWTAHCETVCAELAIPLIQKTVDATANVGESPEDVARQKRYGAFTELLSSNDILLTAHHQDDQAETVLLQLLRGAGPKGLAAMPGCKSLGQGLLLRPFLKNSRADLQAYAEQNHLTWINDESNANTHFSRNFIRHNVLSVLKNRWPTVANTLTRVAENCAEAQHMLDAVALDDLSMIEGSVADTLSIKKLLSLTPDRQRQVLRFWLRQLNFPVPSAIKLQQIQQDMLLASIDKVPHVAWKTVELRRFRDNIYAMTRLPLHDSSQCVEWDLQTSLLLPGINALHAKKIRGQGIFIESEKVTVRFRQGGEICQLPGRDCHHHLKNLLQTWHIPTWLRDRIPLIFVNDKLAAAVGLFIDQKFLATAEQEGYVIAEK